MRFKTSFLITLLFHLTIIVVDKGAGFVIVGLLKDNENLKGALDLLTNVPPILMAVSNLGLAASLVFFTRRKEVSVRVAGETTSLVALVWGGTIALLAFFVIYVWAYFDPKTDMLEPSLLIPLLLTPPFLLLISYRNSIQLVLGRIYGYNVVHLVPSLTYLPAFLLIYFVLTDRDAKSAGVWGRFVPAVCLAVGLAWSLRRYVPLRPRFHGKFFKRALSFGWRANINSALTILNHRLDIYYVWALYIVPGAASLSAEDLSDAIKSQVAYYSLAVTLGELIWHFPEAMRDLLFSKVAGSSEAEAREVTPVICRNSLLICAAGAVVIWFIHGPIIGYWFGTAWYERWALVVTPSLAWLLPGTVFFTIAKILQADLMARHYVHTCIALTATVFVTMTVADVFLVPHYGAVGAAIGSTIGYVCSAVASLIVYVKSTGLPLRDLVLVRREDWEHYSGVLDRLRRRKS